MSTELLSSERTVKFNPVLLDTAVEKWKKKPNNPQKYFNSKQSQLKSSQFNKTYDLKNTPYQA